jgi:hypothetical protein
MENYYCLNIKFKDSRISSKIHHAHLFVSDEEMYFQIIDNDENSRVDNYFSISSNALGFFEDNFEIVDTEIVIKLDKSRIHKIVSFQNDSKDNYFTIYVSNICLIRPNINKGGVNEGKVVLSNNGLKVVNQFYSFFTNLKDKNTFTISRMQGMSDFYKINNMTYRPELEFSNNEKRNSEELTIKKIPTINFRFENLDYEEIKTNNQIISSFLSFCFGIRITINKLIYRTEEEIFIYRNTEPNNKIYISEFSTVFNLLEKNYNIEKILKTAWFNNFLTEKTKINKAIDNYLHSREVNLSASFLLLFNIIEIFNINPNQEYFEYNDLKEENFSKAYKLIEESLSNDKEAELLENKWKGLINKISIKPLKSPLEETLRLNNIKPINFGYPFKKLKETRDKLTHGSVNSIKEEDLKLQIYCLRDIATCLILSNLGLKDDLKTDAQQR